jgi:hypothetical protein
MDRRRQNQHVIEAPSGMTPEQAAGYPEVTKAPAAPAPLPTMPVVGPSQREQQATARNTIRQQLHTASPLFLDSVRRNNEQRQMNARLRGVYGDDTHSMNRSRLDVESQQQGVDPYASQYRESAESRANNQSNADVAVKGGVADAYHGQANSFRGQGDAYRGQAEAYRGEAQVSQANAHTLIPSQARVNDAQANISIPAQAGVARSQAQLYSSQAGVNDQQAQDIQATRPSRVRAIDSGITNETDLNRANIHRMDVENQNNTDTTHAGVGVAKSQAGLYDAQGGQLKRQTELLGQVPPGDAALAEEQHLKNMHTYSKEYQQLHPNTQIPANAGSAGGPSVGRRILGAVLPPLGVYDAVGDIANGGFRQPGGGEQQAAPAGGGSVTEADIQHVMQVHGLTREQAIAEARKRGLAFQP